MNVSQLYTSLSKIQKPNGENRKSERVKIKNPKTKRVRIENRKANKIRKLHYWATVLKCMMLLDHMYNNIVKDPIYKVLWVVSKK